MAALARVLLFAALTGGFYTVGSVDLNSSNVSSSDTEIPKLSAVILLPDGLLNQSGSPFVHPALLPLQPRNASIPDDIKDDSNKTLVQLVIVHNTVIQSNSSSEITGPQINTTSDDKGVEPRAKEVAVNSNTTLSDPEAPKANWNSSATPLNIEVSPEENDYVNLSDTETEESPSQPAADAKPQNSENKADITLELNPNSSDLEFRHSNSTHKTLNGIPNFSAQIFTLSYNGVKKPVLIVQPEMNKLKTPESSSSSSANKTKSTENSEKPAKATASDGEITTIPNFSLHFPLQTNSQFQIPRFNFTLPTLFLPGLIFTQNENPQTNKHEVHVSIPSSGEPFIIPENAAELQLLPVHPPSISPHDEAPDNSHLHSKDPVEPSQSNSTAKENKPTEKAGNGTSPGVGHLTTDRDVTITISVNDTAKTNSSSEGSPSPSSHAAPDLVPQQRPLSISSIHTSLHGQNTHLPSFPPPLVDIKPSLGRPNFTANSNAHKWNLPILSNIYKKWFGAGRLDKVTCDGDSDKEPEQEPEEGAGVGQLLEEEFDATLCGSDGLCGVTCHRLGFYHGKCVDDSSCVCLLKSKPEFGLKLEYFVNKRLRSLEKSYAVHGLCHASSCRINCEREGYVTGLCDDSSCLCGLPWAETTKK